MSNEFKGIDLLHRYATLISQHKNDLSSETRTKIGGIAEIVQSIWNTECKSNTNLQSKGNDTFKVCSPAYKQN